MSDRDTFPKSPCVSFQPTDQDMNFKCPLRWIKVSSYILFSCSDKKRKKVTVDTMVVKVTVLRQDTVAQGLFQPLASEPCKLT